MMENAQEWMRQFLEDAFLKKTNDAIEFLASALEKLTSNIGPPEFIDASDRPRFRYKSPNEHILQVLRCIRIVSALRAAMILVRYGHVTEAGVLFRTIGEFIGDIDFINEAIKNPNSATAEQKKFIENYFIDHSQAEELSQVIPQKKKVRASQARALLPENPDRAVKMLSAIDSMWNSYVHGDYQSAMEMYHREELSLGEETTQSEGFQVHGMWGGSRRISVFRWYFASNVNGGFNAMFTVALGLGLNDVAHALIERRKAFNETKAYTDQIEIPPRWKPCPRQNPNLGGPTCEHNADAHRENGVCTECAQSPAAKFRPCSRPPDLKSVDFFDATREPDGTRH